MYLFGSVWFGGEDEQVGVVGVLHERLFGAAAPLDRVHDVVDDPVFDAADDVDVVQPEVGIRQHDALAHCGEPHAEVGGDGRLAHAALARCDHNFARHVLCPRMVFLLYHCSACARAILVCLRRRREKFANYPPSRRVQICAPVRFAAPAAPLSPARAAERALVQFLRRARARKGGRPRGAPAVVCLLLFVCMPRRVIRCTFPLRRGRERYSRALRRNPFCRAARR